MARAAHAKGRTAGSQGQWTAAILLAAVIIVTALPLCVLFAAGMPPTAAAALVDRHGRRDLTAAVALLNLAGMVVPVLTLVRDGLSMAAALQVLSDPRAWLIMYSAAGVGWVLHAAMPVLARVIIDRRAAREERRLARRAEQLVEEWGTDIRPG
jgi:hypothetical protein